MRLTIVGCAGSYPGPGSAASCYLVQAPHEGRLFSLVLDMGNGALGALQRYVRLEDIDTVALSHLHVDHCIDLLSFHVFRTYRPSGPLGPLPVLGPHGTVDRIAKLIPEGPKVYLADCLKKGSELQSAYETDETV